MRKEKSDINIERLSRNFKRYVRGNLANNHWWYNIDVLDRHIDVLKTGNVLTMSKCVLHRYEARWSGVLGIFHGTPCSLGWGTN